MDRRSHWTAPQKGPGDCLPPARDFPPRDSSAPAKGPDGDLFYAPRALAPFGERALSSALTGAIPYRMPRAISIMLVRASSRSAEEMDCFSPFRVSEMVSRVAALLPLRAAL